MLVLLMLVYIQIAPNFQGILRFVKFAESNIPKFVGWLKKEDLVETYLEDSRFVHATGGGAFRYADMARNELGVEVIPHVCSTKINVCYEYLIFFFFIFVFLCNRMNLDVR